MQLLENEKWSKVWKRQVFGMPKVEVADQA